MCLPAGLSATPSLALGRPLGCLELDAQDCRALACGAGFAVDFAEETRDARGAPPPKDAVVAPGAAAALAPRSLAAGSAAAAAARSALFMPCASVRHMTVPGADFFDSAMRATALLPVSALRAALSLVQPLAAARTARMMEFAYVCAAALAAVALE